MIINHHVFENHVATQAAMSQSLKLAIKLVGKLKGEESDVTQVMSLLQCLASITEHTAADFDNLAFWAKEKDLFEVIES